MARRAQWSEVLDEQKLIHGGMTNAWHKTVDSQLLVKDLTEREGWGD